MTKKQLYIAGGIVALFLIWTALLLGASFLYAQHVKGEAIADATYKAKEEENQRLKADKASLESEIRTLRTDAADQVKAIGQLRAEVAKSPEKARQAVNQALRDAGVGQATEQPQTDAEKAQSEYPDAPSQVLRPEQQQALGDKLLQCKQTETLYAACTKEVDLRVKMAEKDAVILANKDEEVKTLKDVKRPGFWRRVGTTIKIAAPSVATGIIIDIIFNRRKK